MVFTSLNSSPVLFRVKILFPDAYTTRELIYQWQNDASVNFVPGMTLSQFDLMSFPSRNFTFTRREGTVDFY